MKTGRLIAFLSLLLLFVGNVCGQTKGAIQLSDSATISLLTYGATDEIHAMYGHTAIRVNDPEQSLDLVFNYGLFDFSEDDFLMRFVLGQTDYQLGAYPTEYFWSETKTRRITAYEQRLNLTVKERKQLFERLMINLEPQNRTYRYSFLFDNCSTRPYYLIKESVDGGLKDSDPKIGASSFRDAINLCVGRSLWVKLGIEIILGGRIDCPMTYSEQFFLPLYLQERLRTVWIESTTGEQRPLVSDERTLTSYPLPRSETPFYFNPLLLFTILFVALFFVSGIELRRRSLYRWIDVSLYTILGLFGLLIHFMIFFSEHPAVSPNWNGVVLNPLFLLMGIALLFKNRCMDRIVVYAALALSIVSIGAVVFAPQQIPWLILWVSVLVMVRSTIKLKFLQSAPSKGL